MLGPLSWEWDPIHLIALNSEYTKEEIRDTIVSMKNFSSPGPDGLTYEFYKKFETLISPILLKVANEINSRENSQIMAISLYFSF